MIEFATKILEPWHDFYVMAGGAAAALTGLMFVVFTLVSEDKMRRNPDGVSTFSTPTVAHFGAALLVSAILLAPWRTLMVPGDVLVFCGLCGLTYVLYLLRRTKRLSSYTADAEDFTWYLALPFVAYTAILTGGVLLFERPGDALFADGAGVLLLIFIGIHNAWDIVTYIATGRLDDEPDPEKPSA